MYPDDRVLVAIMNNRRDWDIAQDEGWYRLPTKHAPSDTPNFDYLAFYFTKVFKDDRWAIHYYARIEGHELLTRRDLIPSEPDHPRAGQWYYQLQLGPLQHKIPPIISTRWRRITFIVTMGDRFMQAVEINDLFERESPAGQLYVQLKEMGISVEREWLIREAGVDYVADLALPIGDEWLPVTIGDRPAPSQGLHLTGDAELDDWLQVIRGRLNVS